MVAWLGGSALGIVNGTIREIVYKDRLGGRTAHYVSTLTLVALLGAYFRWLETRWPIPSPGTALRIGLAWAVLTASFDFGFGHFVDGKTWSELAEDYDIAAGRIWTVILLWTIVGPLLARRLHQRAGT